MTTARRADKPAQPAAPTEQGGPRTGTVKSVKESAARSPQRSSGKQWQPEQRVAFLADTLGGPTALARMLGVSASQPTRWRRSDEAPSFALAERIIALDSVVASLLLQWDVSVLSDWLTSSNAHLDGARPLDVLSMKGPAAVLQAIQAEAETAFA